MKINCSCQGFNENCFKCFGRGYYDDKELPSRTLYGSNKTKSQKANNSLTARKKVIKKANNSVPPSKPLTTIESRVCPYCRENILNHDCVEHIMSCQVKSRSTKKKEKRIKIGNKHNFTKCPKCQVSVRSDRIDNHMKRVHDNDSLYHEFREVCQKHITMKSNGLRPPHKIIPNIISTNSENRFIHTVTKAITPAIKNTLSLLQKRGSPNIESDANRLSATIAETRAINSSKKKGNSDRNKFALSKYPENLSKSDMGIVEKKINSDGSRDWYTFRDRGKYGSHPSFDSMDDESIP